MAELKKYTSFEAMKSDENSGKACKPEDNSLSEYEAFVKKLQSAYSSKKPKTGNGKRVNR